MVGIFIDAFFAYKKTEQSVAATAGRRGYQLCRGTRVSIMSGYAGINYVRVRVYQLCQGTRVSIMSGYAGFNYVGVRGYYVHDVNGYQYDVNGCV